MENSKTVWVSSTVVNITFKYKIPSENARGVLNSVIMPNTFRCLRMDRYESVSVCFDHVVWSPVQSL